MNSENDKGGWRKELRVIWDHGTHQREGIWGSWNTKHRNEVISWANCEKKKRDWRLVREEKWVESEEMWFESRLNERWRNWKESEKGMMERSVSLVREEKECGERDERELELRSWKWIEVERELWWWWRDWRFVRLMKMESGRVERVLL